MLIITYPLPLGEQGGCCLKMTLCIFMHIVYTYSIF